MYISYKNSTKQLLFYHNDWWRILRNSKGLSTPEFRTWKATLDKDSDENIIYPSENFTIIECTDENIQERLNQLSDYRSMDGVYNIKWSDSKVSATVGEETIQTHFSGDDTARDARVLAEKWANVRRDRDRRLAETDFHALKDSTLANNMKTYRQARRDVPEDNADVDNITWPTKP